MGKELDRTRHHITVHGREESGQAAAYMQDGVYFDGDGKELEGQRATPAAKPAATKATPAAAGQVEKQLAG